MRAAALACCKIALHSTRIARVTILEVRRLRSAGHILQKGGTPNAQHPEECHLEPAYVPRQGNRRVRGPLRQHSCEPESRRCFCCQPYPPPNSAGFCQGLEIQRCPNANWFEFIRWRSDHRLSEASRRRGQVWLDCACLGLQSQGRPCLGRAWPGSLHWLGRADSVSSSIGAATDERCR
jgi:hypothetical protein